MVCKRVSTISDEDPFGVATGLGFGDSIALVSDADEDDSALTVDESALRVDVLSDEELFDGAG